MGDRIADAAWKKWHEHARTTQTGCTLAIQFGIAPADERADVGDALAALVRANGGRIGTGFLGTPFVLFALTSTDHAADAYRLLLNENCPGWLYQVKLGATTTWERWDAIRPDGTVNASDMADGSTMTSFNHYAYGSVAAWLYRSVAGLTPTRPGYREILLAPHPGPLHRAAASIDTEYGTASIDWSVTGSTCSIDVVLPPGTTGRFDTPAGWGVDRPVGTLGSGRHTVVLKESA